MNKSIEFQKMKDDVAYIKKVLAGNGEDGLIKQTKKVSEAIIKIESYQHLKHWILYSAVTILVGICSFLIRYIIGMR